MVAEMIIAAWFGLNIFYLINHFYIGTISDSKP